LHQDVEHPAQVVQMRGAAALPLLPELAGREPGLHQQRGLDQERHQQHLRSPDVAQRLPQEDAVAVVNVGHDDRGLGGNAHHAVGEDHALGRAGRARRVDQAERGAGVAVHERHRLIVVVRPLQPGQVGDGAGRLRMLLHQRLELVLQHRQPRLRMLEDVTQAHAAQAGVDGHPGQPG